MPRQIFLFLITGGIAAALNWSSRFAFSVWLPFELAVVAAYFVGMGAAFVLMRTFVFTTGTRPIAFQVPAFVLVNAAALALTVLVSTTLARWLLPAVGVTRHVEALAHLAGVLAPAFTSFFAHRYITFR